MSEQLAFWISIVVLIIVSGLMYFEKKNIIDFFDHDKNGKTH